MSDYQPSDEELEELTDKMTRGFVKGGMIGKRKLKVLQEFTRDYGDDNEMKYKFFNKYGYEMGLIDALIDLHQKGLGAGPKWGKKKDVFEMLVKAGCAMWLKEVIEEAKEEARKEEANAAN